MTEKILNSGYACDILADSQTFYGDRLTTFAVCFPRYLLAEFNTHRMFSRNSASSRAIPFKKMVKLCKEHPFIPVKFLKEHTGMQGTEAFSEGEAILVKDRWLMARDAAVEAAEYLNAIKVTKQLCNRILEPFMWHTALVTATNYHNFFALRVHEAAEIHIEIIARMMLDCYNASQPIFHKQGEWHIPFGDQFDEARLHALHSEEGREWSMEEYKVALATARCARVSYLTFEGKDDYNNDLKLHDGLAKSGHWSPFEHCAKAGTPMGRMSGNFKGWLQYRKTFSNECRKDPRVIRKELDPNR